jgi:hypothetical protein
MDRQGDCFIETHGGHGALKRYISSSLACPQKPVHGEHERKWSVCWRGGSLSGSALDEEKHWLIGESTLPAEYKVFSRLGSKLVPSAPANVGR